MSFPQLFLLHLSHINFDISIVLLQCKTDEYENQYQLGNEYENQYRLGE